MKNLKILTSITLAIGALCLSCVSPFYGTARVEPGWHKDVGLAATTFVFTLTEWLPYCIGGRGDFELRYGFNEYLQANGRIGLGLGFSESRYEGQSWDGPYPLVDCALGIQAALPSKYVTPALRLELGQRPVTFLLGIGEKERVTVGLELLGLSIGGSGLFSFSWPPLWVDGFISVHISPQWSIFAGGRMMDPEVAVSSPYPSLALGVGYNLK